MRARRLLSSPRSMRGLFKWVTVFAALAPTTGQAKTVDAAPSAAPQQASASVSKASSAVNADAARLLRLYRELNAQRRQPGVEARKAATVAAALGGQGFEVRVGTDGTPIVAILRNGQGPTLIYRADAGPHLEPAAARRTRRPSPPPQLGAGVERGYPGDANLTWMIGMAKAVAALRADWAGTLVLVSEATRRDDDEPEAAARERSEALLTLPSPDVVLALGASSAPYGSMLGVRGRRR